MNWGYVLLGFIVGYGLGYLTNTFHKNTVFLRGKIEGLNLAKGVISDVYEETENGNR